MSAPGFTLGLALTGGGARAAYQVGVLRWIARRYPDLRIPVLTGVSAGAVNVASIASNTGRFVDAVADLAALWHGLSVDKVFKVGAGSIAWTVTRWGLRLVSGGARLSQVRGFLDTSPLRRLLYTAMDTRDGVLVGVGKNIAAGRLSAAAVTATSYSTGQSVVFFQGRDIEPWKRPQRRAEKSILTVEHVMASSALPMFFPAVRLGNEWFGDGGVRLAAPLSPALHLGADRILAISTRYDRSTKETEALQVAGYPPPAQVLGSLLNAVFLDLIDQDALRLQKINELLQSLPAERRQGMRPIDLLVIRPSQDLGALAARFEPRLPRAFRFMTRGLGTREQKSPDMLSLLLFQDDYLDHLIEIGEADAAARAADIEAFLPAVPAASAAS
jgi:NTE family protein